MNLAKLVSNLRELFPPQNSKGSSEQGEAISVREKSGRAFSFKSIAAATLDFSPTNKLGEGGYGQVYKGRLEDGRMVAVKRLGRGSKQGEKEFRVEAKLLSQLQHRNIVNLYGYCLHQEDKMLVYEFVHNQSLDKLLFSADSTKAAEALPWNRRFDVILGVARGLLYLHEDAHTPIIHRDIKPSNILLDERWCPKIADFGMARLFPEDLTHVNTHVAGTIGYMAPEYLKNLALSPKADVYSFGVVVIELISGLKRSAFAPRHDASTLLEWACKMNKNKKAMDILDPALRSTADAEQVAKCIDIGLRCSRGNPKNRPDMRFVVWSLSKKLGSLKDHIRPGVTSLSSSGSPEKSHTRSPSAPSCSSYSKATSSSSYSSSSSHN